MPYKIYLISNKINDKKYVGYTTKELKHRFYQHSRSNKPLGKSIRFHGKETFTIQQIDEAYEIEKALKLEKQWIVYYDSFLSGYNCTKGGDCSPVNRKVDVYKTKEFSDKVKKNAIKQHSNPKTKQAHVDGIKNYWNTLSEEQKEKRRQIAIQNGKKSKVAWNKGLKLPGTGMVGVNNPMAKQYRVWFPDGTEVVINCLTVFCKEHGLTYRNACGVLEGKQKHHKGFRFARLDNHP